MKPRDYVCDQTYGVGIVQDKSEPDVPGGPYLKVKYIAAVLFSHPEYLRAATAQEIGLALTDKSFTVRADPWEMRSSGSYL